MGLHLCALNGFYTLFRIGLELRVAAFTYPDEIGCSLYNPKLGFKVPSMTKFGIEPPD
jgi:hypothetical protein